MSRQFLLCTPFTHYSCADAGDLHHSQAEVQKTVLADEIVPTVDSVRYSFLLAVLLLDKHPVLLTGTYLLLTYLLFVWNLFI